MTQMYLTEITTGRAASKPIPAAILVEASRIASGIENGNISVTIHDYESGREFFVATSEHQAARPQIRKEKLRYSETTTVRTKRVFERVLAR